MATMTASAIREMRQSGKARGAGAATRGRGGVVMTPGGPPIGISVDSADVRLLSTSAMGRIDSAGRARSGAALAQETRMSGDVELRTKAVQSTHVIYLSKALEQSQYWWNFGLDADIELDE